MRYTGARGYARLAIDLSWVALSVILAALIRDNLAISVEKLEQTIVYGVLCIITAAIVFSVARLNRQIWRYVSIIDALTIAVVATITILITILIAFVINRLEGVPRSLPVIQWLVLVSGMVGTRVAIRFGSQRHSRKSHSSKKILSPKEHVLVVGVGDLSDLYLGAVSEFGAANRVIVGLLSSSRHLHGRSMRTQKVLGAPEDVERVIRELDVHGVPVNRIVVAEPFEYFSTSAQNALRTIERSTAIRVDWLMEQLGLHVRPVFEEPNGSASEKRLDQASISVEDQDITPSTYHRFKRYVDATAALVLMILLAPLFALTSLLAAVDVGLPVLFWQQRPGRYGQSFKLFKFRTMRGAHDAYGNRIPDELRSSKVGRFLRRCRLDELPQLYNILIGEMSFVGPRPLLPLDQPGNRIARLLVRPGLTGCAQVNGGRHLSSTDKAAFDEWYILKASLWVDIKIVLRTFHTMIAGDRLHPQNRLPGLIREGQIESAISPPEATRPSATQADEAA